MKNLLMMLFLFIAGSLITGSSYSVSQAQTHTIKGNAGTSNVVLSWTDTTAKTLTTGTNGDFTITVSPNWSGTLTPSKTGFTFNPISRSFTNVTANVTGQNFTATAITFTISGNTGVGAVTLSYNDGGPKNVNSNASGDYSFAVSYNWTGTVTPTKTGYTFLPTNIAYTNVLANQTGQDYAATPITFTISGSTGTDGVTLSWTDGSAKTATSDGLGNYSIIVSYSFDGMVTPSKIGYTFSPTSRTYSNVVANQVNQNYTPTIAAYTIAGNAGTGNAVLSWTDTIPKTVTASASGAYSIVVSGNWSGTVTPSKTGFTFTPVSISYTNVTANQNNKNYTAAPTTYTISGNAGTNGVTLSYTDGTVKTATSAANGTYSFAVSYNWSGTVTPTKTGYTFAPVNVVYTNVLANQTGQDYGATPITFTISGNAGVAGATISWTDGTPKTATADGSGLYSIIVSYSYDGTVTPTKTGYTFSPSNRTYNNVIANQVNQNYTATSIKYTISGDAGTAGVLLSWVDTTAKSVVAGSGGNYSIVVSYGWSGTITPSRTGYTFTPLSRTYTNVLANNDNENYTQTAGSTIYGNAGINAATMSYTDGTAKTVTSNASGIYALIVSPDWSGTVTPTKAGYTFTPVSKAYTHVNADIGAQDYTVTPVTFTISGNAGIAGALLSWTDGTAKSTLADLNGDYSFEVSYSFDGDVTPSKAGYVFSPTKIHYTNVLADMINQNYTVTPAKFTISGKAGRSGVVLNWVDTTAKSVTSTGPGGDYTFTVSYGWSGTVTPDLTGFAFTPASRLYSNVLANHTVDNYTATACVTANLKVFLTGPFSSGSMTTGLNTLAIIPLTSETAYAAATYGYTAKVVPVIPRADIVDWVLVELRSGTAASTKVGIQAAFVKSDGTVIDANGISPVKFPSLAAGSYYAVIRHRNHLPLMTAAALTINATSAQYDFTTAQSQAFGTNAMYALTGGVFGMQAGDVNRDGSVIFTNVGSDRQEILNVVGAADPTLTVNGYLDTDANLDGKTKFTGNGSDRQVILNTVGFVDPTLQVHSQVPN